ncbi:hypothetical protein HUG10_17895 [Halorarum halophilum]|uniref:Uncharacterized protein n=1 Tax=Halorarum halophilum TaxID=2743090 RepID=A0A7D5GZ71_9EURY|nr:hypothetical protein [Halobaculum halophilum]QLG29289.1 hypothetical protein HUG10_17895 [Halobaculum halophilum]
MGLPASLRPRRTLALPFVLVSFPLLWFVMREAGIGAAGRPVTDVLPRVVALATVALAVSGVVAILVDAALDIESESVPSWVRPLVSPSNGALATFTAVSLALAVYIVAGSLVALPGWFDALASAIGVVIGWPLLLVVLGTYAVGNAVPTLQDAFAIQVALVAAGVALSAAWMLLLSGWLAGLIVPGDAVRTGP